MYEFSIAFKYLIPRLRYLSVSIISTISCLVIACVVWLTIVFFSATEGLEARWTDKLVTLTAPVRILPTAAYYDSYYYLIDSMSEASNFATKTFREKLDAKKVNPYNAARDAALPVHFPKPIVNPDGSLKDLAKGAMTCVPRGAVTSFFETAYAMTSIQVAGINGSGSRFLTQPSYLITFDGAKNLDTVLLPERPLNPVPGALRKKNGLWILPENGVLLPRSFRDAGIHIGDRGTFTYYGYGATSIQERHIPFVVSGFYDPGIIPIGGKLIITGEKTISLITAGAHDGETVLPTGMNVNFRDWHKATQVRDEIRQNLKKAYLDSFFEVQSYDEYDFTRDLYQQLKSERNLFSLISLIIIIVACSNIISMLIILVHDKSREIAILRALGASRQSIGFIFGFCGFFLGIVGAAVGSVAAYFTVLNLPALLSFLSSLQGFDVLNATFYGEIMPTELSHYAVWLVISSTAAISTLAGAVAAYKAARQNTSEALKVEA
jgi:lipoprotein-releasing system permease protein